MCWVDIVYKSVELIIPPLIGGGIGGLIVGHYLERKRYSYKYFEDRKREAAQNIFQESLNLQGRVQKLHIDLLDSTATDWSSDGKKIDDNKNALVNAIKEASVYIKGPVYEYLMDAVKVTESLVRRMSLAEVNKKKTKANYGYNPQYYIDWYDNYYMPWVTDTISSILKGREDANESKWKDPPTIGSMRIGAWP